MSQDQSANSDFAMQLQRKISLIREPCFKVLSTSASRSNCAKFWVSLRIQINIYHDYHLRKNIHVYHLRKKLKSLQTHPTVSQFQTSITKYYIWNKLWFWLILLLFFSSFFFFFSCFFSGWSIFCRTQCIFIYIYMWWNGCITNVIWQVTD